MDNEIICCLNNEMVHAIYPDNKLYVCPDCGQTKWVSGIGTNIPDLTCKCRYPQYMNNMIEMIPKPQVKLPKDSRKRYRLKRQREKELYERRNMHSGRSIRRSNKSSVR